MPEAFVYKNPCNWVPEIPGAVAYVIFYNNGEKYIGYTEQFNTRMKDIFNGLGIPQFNDDRKAQHIMHYQRCNTKEKAAEYAAYLKSSMGTIFLRTSNELRTIIPQ
jgi:predicted GIY-YIG superfamily endonuclease